MTFCKCEIQRCACADFGLLLASFLADIEPPSRAAARRQVPVASAVDGCLRRFGLTSASDALTSSAVGGVLNWAAAETRGTSAASQQYQSAAAAAATDAADAVLAATTTLASIPASASSKSAAGQRTSAD
jgi:hypothetical protein